MQSGRPALEYVIPLQRTQSGPPPRSNRAQVDPLPHDLQVDLSFQPVDGEKSIEWEMFLA